MIRHLEGDCRQTLPTLPAKSVHCCVTSPPYFRLRSYLPEEGAARDREIGQEVTVKQYIENLVSVFRGVARVLLNDGTLWLNLGDTYAKNSSEAARRAGVKPGELIGVPWRVAQALQNDGWYLRSDIIWHKSNPKPESVKNRPTKAHEYLFLLSRSERYYYDVDALREPVTSTGGACFGKQRHSTAGTGAQSRRLARAAERNHPLGKNKRSVWKIPVRSFPGAHFAVFPKELARPCILAGSPVCGIVLDPFAGSGTTGEVAEELGRDAILIELNPVYVAMQQHRGQIQSVVDPPQAAGATDPRKPGWLF